MENALSRRNFLRAAGIAGAATVGIPTTAQEAWAVGTPMSHIHAPAGVPAATNADEMDAHHEEGVKIFLDNIGKDELFWNNRLEPRIEDGVKVFELTCTEMDWDVASGQVVKAMTFNGTVPGPEIRVTEGDKVRIIVHNEMSQSTGIHWHGVIVPNNMDGVPYITQPPIKPGESFTYEFTAKNSGSHMYHSHHNALEQVTKGLLGAFIIDRKDPSKDPQYDAEYTIILNDAGIGMTINGRSFPYTQPIVAQLGDKIRIRYMNEGLQIHPMHLHGLEQIVFAKDGWKLPLPYTCDTVNVAPGERFDVLVHCHTPGVWAFHCHILSHAESAHGMFGMVTAMVVEE